MNPQFAILIDGGFMTKRLSSTLKRYPTADDIQAEVARIKGRPELAGHDLLRVYFYDAPPATGVITNRIDGARLDLRASTRHREATALFDSLELRPDFALRMGETAVHGWKLGPKAVDDIMQTPRVPVAGDFVPAIEQKGVDLRIGLDIARLSLRQLVRTIVVVTGDSDLVPAFRFARREGLRVFLDVMGHGVKRELRAHADLVL